MNIDPNMRQADFFSAFDREAAIQMTDAQRERLAALRHIARTEGLGGPARGEYALLCAKEAEERRRG